MRHFHRLLLATLLLPAVACGGDESADDGGGGTGGTGGGCDTPVELTNADIEGGTVLAANTCWFVEENLTLDDGTVEIEEGVSITFATGVAFRVNAGGLLKVMGTSTAPVAFTTDDELVTWQGLYLNDSQGTDNDWQYLEIENAGSDPWSGADYSTAALFLEGSTTLAMDHVSIIASGGHGLVARGETNFSFSNGAFIANDTPAYLHPNVVASLGSETTFSNNTNSHVRVVFGNTDRVNDDQTWPALDVPYRVEDRFFVAGALTIADGAVFEMAQDVSMIVETGATLTAVGTDTDGITFRGEATSRGFWKGIEIESGGTGTPLEYGATFDHVEIADAGSSQWSGAGESTAALYLQDDSAALITNTTFRNNGRYGIWASTNARLDGFSSNTFTNNARVMLLHPDRVGELAGTSTISGNDDDRVHVVFGNTDTVTMDATWQNLGVPYEIVDRFFVDAALIIEAGTTLEFGQDVQMIVRDGSLTTSGTAGEPVTFTGVNAVALGYWSGVRVQTNDPANALTHTVLEYTGATTWTGDSESDAALYLDDGAQLSLDNVTVGPGGGYGIFLASSASSLACSNVTFDTLEDGAIWDDDAPGVLADCP